jgi:hypothetical protein
MEPRMTLSLTSFLCLLRAGTAGRGHSAGVVLFVFCMIGSSLPTELYPNPSENKNFTPSIVFQIVVIMRGLPGSGKTHVAKLIRVSMGK